MRPPNPSRWLAMTLGAAYYVETEGGERDPYNWVAESSRRARGFPIYAALRSLGRSGLADMIDHCCAIARRMAEGLAGAPGVEILNDVVLNQVLVRFRDREGRNITPSVIARIQEDRVCWAGGTSWRGEPALRLSISGWSTREADVETSAGAILRGHQSLIANP